MFKIYAKDCVRLDTFLVNQFIYDDTYNEFCKFVWDNFNIKFDAERRNNTGFSDGFYIFNSEMEYHHLLMQL